MSYLHGKKWKIRKSDQVIVITGRDKGKKGEVLRIYKDKGRVLVQGINMVKRHRKASVESQGGIEEQEAPIHISNVALIDPQSSQGSRVGYRFLEDKTKKRFTKKSGEIID